MQWRNVREILLSCNRTYRDGEDAYNTITHKRGLGKLIENLQRTRGIQVKDYVAFLEWHTDGYPHWHILIETDRPAMIGYKLLKHYWPFGLWVTETYIKSQAHWDNLTGYFEKHGYWEHGKGTQGKLPSWALGGTRLIRRVIAKKHVGHYSGANPTLTGSNETEAEQSQPPTPGITLQDILDVFPGAEVIPCPWGGLHPNLMPEGQQAPTLGAPPPFPKRVRETYTVILAKCGASCLLTIDGPGIHHMTRVEAPYSLMKTLYPWEYREGQGLTLTLYGGHELLEFARSWDEHTGANNAQTCYESQQAHP